MRHHTLLSACLRAGFCLALLLSAQVLFGQTVKTIDLSNGHVLDDAKETTPTRDVEIVDDGVIVKYKFHYATLQPDPLYKNAFSLNIKGFGKIDIEGLPALPSRMDSFTVPSDFTASATVIDSSFIDMPMEFSPARPPMFDNGHLKYTLENVPPIIPYNGLFPQKLIPETTLGTFRGSQIFDVGIIPVKYDYQNKKVSLYTEIKYKVTFIPQSERNLTSSSKKEFEDNTFLNNVTLNGISDDTKNRYSRSLVLKDYQIISVPQYAEAVERFAKWKRMLGFNVHIEYRQTWTPTTIKSFVTDKYDDYDNLVYLLIIGSHDDVPAKPSASSTPYYSDYSYGVISNENYQEICVGRLPVESLSEANIAVNKIIGYEQTPVNNTSFYQNGLLIANFQDLDTDSYEDLRFVETCEEILQYLNTTSGYNFSRVFNAESTVNPLYWSNFYSDGTSIPSYLMRINGFAWNGDSVAIRNSINAGNFLTLYNGHGSYSNWYSPSFDYNSVMNLTNQNKLPVVFSMGCETGRFIHAFGKSLCEYFLLNSHGGGVGIVGATDNVMPGYADIIAIGMCDAIWPGIHPTLPGTSNNYSSHSAIYSLGDVLRQGKKVLAESSYLSGGSRKLHYYLYHCLGDPSMQIYTAKPTAFSGVTIEGTSEKVSVNLGSETATITFYNETTDSIASYYGSTAEFNGNTDNITVCISAHNKIPYIATSSDYHTYYIQNETIGGTKTFQANTVKIGSNVTNLKPTGSVLFNGVKTTIIGNNVEINGETTIGLGTEFEIQNE